MKSDTIENKIKISQFKRKIIMHVIVFTTELNLENTEPRVGPP
jgi:hypothetical protein